MTNLLLVGLSHLSFAGGSILPIFCWLVYPTHLLLVGLSYPSFAGGSILAILARVVDPEIHHLVGSTSSPLARMENQPSREEDVEVDVDEDNPVRL